MLRDIVFRTHLDAFRRALLGDPPPRVEPMIVRLQPGARAVRVAPHASSIVHIADDETCWAYRLSRWVTRSEVPVCAHATVKYTEVLFARSDKFSTKEVVRGVQAAAGEGGSTRDTAMEVVSRDSQGLYRVEHDGHRAISVKAGADCLKKRLLDVCPPGGDRTPRGRCDDGSA